MSLRASVLAALLLFCVLSCTTSEPSASASRVVFGNAWTRARARSRSSQRNHCGSTCQAERSKSSRSVCLLPDRDAGRRCGDEKVRYTYVAASNSCVAFLYGGCRGNANNFASFVQCRDLCKTATKPTRLPPPASRTISKTLPWSGGRRPWSQSQRGRQSPGRQAHGFRQSFQPGRGSGRIHFEVGPRRGQGVGPRSSLGVAPRRGQGVGPRRGQGVGPRRGQGVGPRRGQGVGPRRGQGVASLGGTGLGRRSGWHLLAARPRRRGGPSNTRRSKSRLSCLRPSHQEGWPCADPAVRYTYLAATNSCVPFEFGGCGGSTNNFASFDQCRDVCKSPPPDATKGDSRLHFPAAGHRTRKRKCRLPWRAGPCQSFGPLLRYYYDARQGSCQRALYSGCGGNVNRFVTRRACERTCDRG